MERSRPLVSAMHPLLIAAILAGALAAPAAAQKAGEVPLAPPGPGAARGKTLEWISAEGKPFWYRLPEKLDARDPPSLVIMLHGTGLPWGWAFWNYPIANGAFRGGDIVLAPEGLTPGRGETFNFVQGEKDARQIVGLIKLFRGRFPLDKVYLYGHSQGAFFSYWFAGEYPEIVDGIVAHAGNVLGATHSELAKEKVAIGILHGKADAVVPVECAHRTYGIYKEQGYKRLKLYIVDGLTEKSGHWPLPKQVAELLDWLDQVSVQTPSGLLDAASSEMTRERPEIVVVVDALARAEALLRGYRGGDRKELQARLDLLQAFVDDARSAHAAAIEEASREVQEGRYESWMGHFVSAHSAFAASREWVRALRKPVQDAARHDRLVEQAAKLVDARPGRASFAQAAMVVEKAPLSGNAKGLVQLLLRLSENPPPGVGSEAIAAFGKSVEERLESMAKGEEEASAITARVAAEFRAEHPGAARRGRLELSGDGPE